MLAGALAQHSTLTELYSGGNQIGDEGAAALAQNATLTYLNLFNNQIGDEMKAELIRVKAASLRIYI